MVSVKNPGNSTLLTGNLYTFSEHFVLLLHLLGIRHDFSFKENHRVREILISQRKVIGRSCFGISMFLEYDGA